jgi:methyl coenzyme M reductase subunit D
MFNVEIQYVKLQKTLQDVQQIVVALLMELVVIVNTLGFVLIVKERLPHEVEVQPNRFQFQNHPHQHKHQLEHRQKLLRVQELQRRQDLLLKPKPNQ